MKNIILLIFCSILSNFSVKSQSNFNFRPVTIPSSAAIQDLKFIDSLRGIAIDHYQIFSTVDAGENWNLKFTFQNSSGLSKINAKQDSIVVTGFYGTQGPTHISFKFNDVNYQSVNIPNTHNLAYIYPILFNDSMWSTSGTGMPATDGLLVIKGANYRRIDTSGCILDIYDNRISYFNQTVLKYSVDSGKNWTTVSNLPISTITQSYFDGNSTIYVHKQGNSSNQYEDSAYVSNDAGLTWSRLSSTTIPAQLNFIDSNRIIGTDSNNLYYSFDSGISFSKILFDSTHSTYYSRLWVHSNDRYFVWSYGKGLQLIDNSLITGISKPSSKKLDFQVVPNPSNGLFSIAGDVQKMQQVDFYDSTGKLVKQLSPKTANYDLNGYPEGLYFISILSDGMITTKKIVITY